MHVVREHRAGPTIATKDLRITLRSGRSTGVGLWPFGGGGDDKATVAEKPAVEAAPDTSPLDDGSSAPAEPK